MTLSTKVFLSSDRNDGFGVTSTIIYGEHDAILVDAQFTIANAYRLVAELIELDRNLKFIFITHFHPDHYLGLEIIKHRYPEASIIAYEKTATEINDAYDFKLDYWGNTVLKNNGANIKFVVENWSEDEILLEGEVIQILGLMSGDCIDITPLWIPSSRTLIASDLVFADCHVWIADMRTPELLKNWSKSLDKIEALKPQVVVPGHSSKALTLHPSAISFTRQYINDFIRELNQSENARQLIEAMDRIYPNFPVRICLEYSAKILKDKYVWPGDWPLSLRFMPSGF
ncbi:MULTISPECIES: MBL fold metallo-hydrolase [Pantoea]|uniref:MBL fold metallo-hydrolase n=1 Tax=Pantoea TaxID=53335 RepID=UPI000CF53076|nr:MULTISPECIES: MBL fold metallo-hydrolase [Pantoea]MCH9299861.1 MBL fold metallo-hydrolase [Pantoea allii]PQK83728.1 MBL fold hydrolase [Pantoea ananatis]PQK87814.1 MBL fold hydrolase [Pantoea ananatis]PWV60358.1 glyoxylase-like metal-dependent hydrolase (beta-lactamase superfamily II) [Pantoea ananatis]PWV83891.1 glyoxylase-like metal-dependent hydrolase (beta-lactamase superfamily II) [Pantoea ananatis]